MKSALRMVWLVLQRAVANTATRQRYSLTKIINYVAVVAVGFGIAWFTGTLQVLHERSLLWLLALASLAIVFLLEVIVQSYLATYQLGRESATAATAATARIDATRLQELYDEGKALTSIYFEEISGGTKNRKLVDDWREKVSLELQERLPSQRFGFDSAGDLEPMLREKLNKHLGKLRLIIMHIDSGEFSKG